MSTFKLGVCDICGGPYIKIHKIPMLRICLEICKIFFVGFAWKRFVSMQSKEIQFKFMTYLTFWITGEERDCNTGTSEISEQIVNTYNL